MSFHQTMLEKSEPAHEAANILLESHHATILLESHHATKEVSHLIEL